MFRTIAMGLLTLLLCSAVQARAATPVSARGTTIKTSGSYVLTKNLKLNLGASAGACITVAADYVTIDLDGFTISCGGDTNAFGIIEGSSGGFSGIIVRNGIITGDCYVGLFVASSMGILVDQLSTITNSSTGMAGLGQFSNPQHRK